MIPVLYNNYFGVVCLRKWLPRRIVRMLPTSAFIIAESRNHPGLLMLGEPATRATWTLRPDTLSKLRTVRKGEGGCNGFCTKAFHFS